MQEHSSTTLEPTLPVRARRYNLDEAKAKIISVFRYLEELHRVRTPPNVHIDNYDWHLALRSLPHFPTVQTGQPFDSLGEPQEAGGAAKDGCVLKVARPTETECPQPSVVIKNWLKSGWDRVGVEPAVFSERKLKTASDSGAREAFDDSDERVQAFEDWLKKRRSWELKERQVVDALDAFSALFELWGKFQRESEKYQLFLADGMLVADVPDGQVKHPVLLQRVELEFDPLIPEFVIRETTDNPEIYTPLLRYLNVDGRGLLSIQEAISKEHFHPLDTGATSQFFKDLVQRFWPDGQYFENESLIGTETGPFLYRHPVIFLGNRNQGFTNAIERYIEAVLHFDDFPESLLRIVGIDTGRAEEREDGEEPRKIDLLLTKDANPEQENVIRRLEETGAVIVQGPPGTGKSHTIANLIGHLLAEKKSILVTSHASKALRVVREHVVKPLQALCVSLLDSDDESTRQLEESINGIVNYLSTTSRRKLEKEIAKLAESREKIKERHNALREQLLTAIQDEYREIEVLGEKHPPSIVAKKLQEYQGEHSWIPGPVAPSSELPLEMEELRELYDLTGKLTEEDEQILASSLPELERIPTPQDFAALYDQMAQLERENRELGSEFWIHAEQTPETLSGLIDMVAAATKVFAEEKDWIFECIEAGRDRERERVRQSWLGLARLIEKCCAEIPEKEGLILEYGPKVRSDRPAKELVEACEEITRHLNSGEKLDPRSPTFKPGWRELIQSSEIDDGPPTRLEHFQAILFDLEVRALREDLVRRWDRHMDSLDAPNASELGGRPEKKAKPYSAKILLAANWYEEHWSNCESAFEEAGFDWNRLLHNTPAGEGVYGETLAIRDLLADQLVPILRARETNIQFEILEQRRKVWLDYLIGFSKKEASYAVVKILNQGIKRKNFDTYSQARRRVQELEDSRPDFERRKALLEKLEPAASSWAHAIRERSAPHDQRKIPGDVVKAWKFRQWDQILTAQHAIDLDALQTKLNAVADVVREVTAEYVEKLAWAAEFERTGLKQQQALTGWLALHKKMGKGTGKHVARLKEEAKKTLVECRQAVPVWIMPLTRVVESFDIATTQFDVVILDEASQNDVLGLVALAMGKEAVVVGDHEQVSPYAVGHDRDKVQGLIDEILVEIPNEQLYDGKTSVYDLARQSFGGTIRLLEHFRCVPDIIQFSNQLCYGGEILPLREASDSKVEPHLIALAVKKGVAVNKVNEREAQEVAALVCAICRFEQYDDCTIGVISMVGTEQALRIEAILRRRLSVSEYKKRRLLCGNAAQFQGDERDVMFLSMVDSPRQGPLPIRQREDAKKVFNVAASRARDQLWVVYSLDPERDLKTGDLRLQLITHVESSARARRKVKGEQEFSSEFEERIYDALSAEKFRPILRYRLGEYTIDMVVEGSSGRRVAIFCEGDRSHPTGGLADVIDRHLILERLGWKFIRLRASKFFREPEALLKTLFKRLKAYGIDRIEDGVSDSESAESRLEMARKLKKDVLRRAEMIRSRWK